MEKNLDNLKIQFWSKIRDYFKKIYDIGEFNDNLFNYNDIPRIFYKNRVVLPKNILIKYLNNNNLLEIERFILNSFILSLNSYLKFDEKNIKILADSICCIEFGSIEGIKTQLEQAFFYKIYTDMILNKSFKDVGLEEKQNLIKNIYKKINEWNRDKNLYRRDIDNL